MLEGGIRDGNRLFEVNRCATISPQEPASVNRLRQFSSESFPPRKWQILAFLVVFLSWRSPPRSRPSRAAGKCTVRLSPKANLHPPTVNRQLLLHFAPRREGLGGHLNTPRCRCCCCARRSAKSSQHPAEADGGRGEMWESLTHGGKEKTPKACTTWLKIQDTSATPCYPYKRRCPSPPR